MTLKIRLRVLIKGAFFGKNSNFFKEKREKIVPLFYVAKNNFPVTNDKKRNKKYRKGHKFWNSELANLWFKACVAEKNYLSFKVRSNTDLQYKNTLRLTGRP